MIEITKQTLKFIKRHDNDVIISTPMDSKMPIGKFTLECCPQLDVLSDEFDTVRFNFDTKRYYKFDDFEELCCWYLQRRNFMIEYKNDVGYVPHIHADEPIEITNHVHCSEVYDMPEIPKENYVYHKKITRREKLKDVLELLHLYKLRENTLDMLKDETIKKRDYTKDLFIQQLERDQERIERFLDEEIDV